MNICYPNIFLTQYSSTVVYLVMIEIASTFTNTVVGAVIGSIIIVGAILLGVSLLLIYGCISVSIIRN